MFLRGPLKWFALCCLVLMQSIALCADFSHQDFDTALRAHVRDGRVNYPGLATDQGFSAYLDRIAEFDPDTLPSPTARLAFWVNAYNALAVQGILKGQSPESWVGKYRYFVRQKYRVGGRETNLYDLEHKIILPFGEPRVHFALVCASASCPQLRSEAYAGERLHAQLQEQARIFINDPTRNRFDREQKIARLSKIFDWFEDDFTKAGGSVIGFVAEFVASPELAADLKGGNYRIDYLDYDWSLNGPAPRP